MATFPKSSPYVVVGAGIHGLSTAYHLAKELTQRGLGSGRDVLVLDKHSPGSDFSSTTTSAPEPSARAESSLAR